jgi:hypothetical protein
MCNSSRLSFVGQQRKEDVILPLAVDLQIAECETLLTKSGLGKKISRGLVRGQARGFDPVKTQRAKDEWNQRADGIRHIALSREALADPIAEGATLGDATAYV